MAYRTVSSRRDPFGDVVNLELAGNGWICVVRQPRVAGEQPIVSFVSRARARAIAKAWLRAAELADATVRPTKRRGRR